MKQVGYELTVDDVVQTGEPPAHLRMYCEEVLGPASFTMAARDLLAGKAVEFTVCERKDAGPPIVQKVVRVQVPKGLRVMRYCGENGDPMGNGSSTVYGSGSLDNAGGYEVDDLPMLVSCLCHAVMRSGWVFRTK